ncbi:hypothetical protein [Chloroflexus sp.]|uniref:hypothetical protein n=1 Tax=Chloroflexus sp. TaxID=1904827 RepID=UPI002ACD9A83|nr:hypothetical protein [Chloroflexus sp.]
MVVSLARDIGQDYGLYQNQIDGSVLRLLYDNPGTAEVRDRFLAPCPLPPIIPDRITQVPSLLPPTAAGLYDKDGTFIFDALNVYANGPVDSSHRGDMRYRARKRSVAHTALPSDREVFPLMGMRCLPPLASARRKQIAISGALVSEVFVIRLRYAQIILMAVWIDRSRRGVQFIRLPSANQALRCGVRSFNAMQRMVRSKRQGAMP